MLQALQGRLPNENRLVQALRNAAKFQTHARSKGVKLLIVLACELKKVGTSFRGAYGWFARHVAKELLGTCPCKRRPSEVRGLQIVQTD